jgi:hypothetical protein
MPSAGQRSERAYLAEGVQPIAEADGTDWILIETREQEGSGPAMLEIERLARLVLA